MMFTSSMEARKPIRIKTGTAYETRNEIRLLIISTSNALQKRRRMLCGLLAGTRKARWMKHRGDDEKGSPLRASSAYLIGY